jgi:lipopolysaccharide biosynthesis regulator YciM
MAKLTVFLVILFLAVLSVFAFFNKGSVDVTVWHGITYENVPMIALILISTSAGIFAMFLIAAIRDARRYLDTWQVQRQQKKQAKIEESYSKGCEALFARRYEEAEELFTRVIGEEPAHLNALLRLGDIYFIKSDFRKTTNFYLKAREVSPRSIETLLSLANVSEAQYKWQDSIKYLDTLLDIDEHNPGFLYRKRGIYEKNNQWEEVLEVQAKVFKCKLSPEEEEKENKNLLGYKFELAKHLLATGEKEKAIKSLKAIIKTDKEFIAAYLTLGETYIAEGNNKEAEATLLKGYEVTSSPVLLIRLEEHYISIGEPSTIIDIYQKAINKDPKDYSLQFFIAKLYYRLEMIDYAFDAINAIDAAAFNHSELHTLLGNVYERRSEHEKAVEEFKKALGADKPLMVPYCCSNCSHISRKWSGRCPECKNWNTLIIDINEICKIQKRQSSS